MHLARAQCESKDWVLTDGATVASAHPAAAPRASLGAPPSLEGHSLPTPAAGKLTLTNPGIQGHPHS